MINRSSWDEIHATFPWIILVRIFMKSPAYTSWAPSPVISMVITPLTGFITKTWVWPLPSNSDHQDYYSLIRESQPKPLFATVTGKGPHPNYNPSYLPIYKVTYRVHNPSHKKVGARPPCRISWRRSWQGHSKMITNYREILPKSTDHSGFFESLQHLG